MRAIFLLTILFLGAVSAIETPYYDEYDELGLSQPQADPTGEPVTYKSYDQDQTTSSTASPPTTESPSPSTTQESTTQSTTQEPVSIKSEDPTKSPEDYATVKSELPTPEPSEEQPTEYAAGRTYEYHYTAQILTGNPEMSSQYTGYQMRCRVLFTWTRGRRVIMRLRAIRFGQTNRVLPVRRPVVVMPHWFFRKLRYRQDYMNIVRMLQLPVSFHWTPTGWVKQIRVSRRDVFWSLNLKKGLMTMLNMNLRLKPSDINSKTNGILKRTKYFEDGIDGHCKATYEYRRFPYMIRKLGKLISMTKTRDLSKCKQKPWFNHMLFLPSTCSESRKPIFALTKSRYMLSAVRHSFFLRDIRTTSQYSYNERDIKDGSITSFVVQRLRYVKRTLSTKEHETEVESAPHTKGLMMHIPIPEWEKVKRDSPKRLVAAKIEAVKILRNYMRDDLDMYENMRNFIQIVRRLSKNDILKLMTKIHQEPEMKKVKNKDILNNIISKAATKEVVEAILVIIKRRSQHDDTTAMLVSRLSGMSFVNSGRMIKKMMDLTLAMRSPKQRETYKSLLFTIGKLINTHYTMPIPVPPGKSDIQLSRQAIKNFYLRLLRKPSTVLSSKMQKVVVLGSLGNCGLVKPCLDLIEPYVQPRFKDRRLIPRVCRQASLYGLISMARKAPLRVRKLVLPVLYDVREDAELRFSAYDIFMLTQPGLSDLKLMSKVMTSDPVRQLRSYIATHLNLLSSTKDRCLAPLALNVSRILREVPPEIANPEGLQFSRMHGLRIPLQEKVAWLLGAMKLTPKNFLPRQIDLGVIAQALGLNVEVGWLIVRAEDAQRLLDPLLGPDGTARMVKSLRALLKPIAGRSKVNTDYMAGSAMYSGIYSLNGLSKEVVDTLRKGMIPVPRDFYRLATQGGALERRMESLSFVDQLSKIPTAFGVPMTVNHTLTAHLKLKAVVVAKPKLMSTRATVGLRVKVAASYRHELRAGPDMTIIKSFVDAMHQGHVPRVTGGIRLGWVSPKSSRRRDRLLLRVNLERPQKDKKVCHLSGRLATAQWSQAKPWKPVLNHMQHRSLPVPRTTTKRLITSKPLGLALDLQHRVLNFTGILPLLKVPLFAPRDIKIMLRRSRVGGDKGVDFTSQILLTRSHLRSMAGEHPQYSNGSMQSDDLFSRKESSDETMWEEKLENSSDGQQPTEKPERSSDGQQPTEKPERSSDGQQPTEEPPQSFTPKDDGSDQSGPAFFTEGPELNDTSDSSSDDQPQFLSEMDDGERKAFFASQRRLKTVFVQVVMRLDKLPLNGRPRFDFGRRGVIWRLQAKAAALRRRNGFSFSVLSLKRKSRKQSILVQGIALANNAIMRARFFERHPLRIISNMQAKLWMSMRVNGRHVGFLHNTASMGKMWKWNMERIIRNKNKQLPVFPTIQRCLRDIKGRKLFGTPACYQAWKDINALSQIRSQAHIYRHAPQWLKQSSVLLFNYLRWSQIDALRVSKYVRPTGTIRIRGDWQLSPYDQRLVSGYQRIISIWDRYVNARLWINRRNSIAESPSTCVISNIFDGLQPARCEIVRRRAQLSWRTFDNVHRYAKSKLASRAGRVVLVQDLGKRLLVTEQRSRRYRITHIRLRRGWQHAMIVTRTRGSQVPRVFFRGRFRRLPFKLYNRRKQVILAIYRDPTPRTRWSLSAVMPEVGCIVRTNPSVSTEISLSPFFFSNVRGICGDFNGEKFDDPKGPMCHAVFPYAQSFLRRHTTILRGWPPLKHMEWIPSMRKFMLAKQCPDYRFYPYIIQR